MNVNYFVGIFLIIFGIVSDKLIMNVYKSLDNNIYYELPDNLSEQIKKLIGN